MRTGFGRLVWLGVVLFLPGISKSAAAGVEYRDFNIAVDGKPAGQYRMTIKDQGNGNVVMTGEANVKVTLKVFFTYTYFYRGTETWQGYRLTRLDSTANDNGKKLAVTAAAEGNGLRITATGQTRVTPTEVWTTTYWRLPDAKYRSGAVVLLDADTGNLIDGRIQYVGTNALSVAGQTQNCAHYRVTGKGVQVDAWYDSSERLVRQESIEDGYRTTFELAAIRR